MKKSLVFASAILVSGNQALACKLSATSADALQMAKVLEHVAENSQFSTARIISVTNRQNHFLVEMRNDLSLQEFHAFQAHIEPNCTITVEEIFK